MPKTDTARSRAYRQKKLPSKVKKVAKCSTERVRELEVCKIIRPLYTIHNSENNHQQNRANTDTVPNMDSKFSDLADETPRCWESCDHDDLSNLNSQTENNSSNCRRRKISSKRRVRFKTGYKTEYICREDFINEEAWNKFLRYCSYRKLITTAAYNRIVRKEKEINRLKGMIDTLEQKNEFHAAEYLKAPSISQQNNTRKKRKAPLPEAKNINASVYHYLQTEFEDLKSYTGGSCDLSPLANIPKRTATATGVCEETVTAVSEEGKTSEESLHDSVPSKRALIQDFDDEAVSAIQMEVVADVYQQQTQQKSQRNIQSTQTRPYSNAERQKRYRERRKADKLNACTTFSQSSDVQPQQEEPQHEIQINKRQPLSSAERQRKYRKLLREQRQQQQQMEDFNTFTVLSKNIDPAELARKRHLNKQRQSRFRARQRFESPSTSSHQAQAERKVPAIQQLLPPTHTEVKQEPVDEEVHEKVPAIYQLLPLTHAEVKQEPVDEEVHDEIDIEEHAIETLKVEVMDSDDEHSSARRGLWLQIEPLSTQKVLAMHQSLPPTHAEVKQEPVDEEVPESTSAVHHLLCSTDFEVKSEPTDDVYHDMELSTSSTTQVERRPD